jgi:HAD superfamily hydrolase (TIGR01549 family)
MPSPVRAIVFDLFDTLVDLALEDLEPVYVDGELVSPTAPRLHEAFSARQPIPFADFVTALRDVDRVFRNERYREGREVPTLERFAALAGSLGAEDPALPSLLTDIHMSGLQNQVRYVAHHPEVLQALGQNVQLALCSNFTHAETAEAVLEQAGLRPLLDAEVISERIGWRKPRPEIFEATLALLGAEPGEVMHVGDNLDADVRGAGELGIRTVWVTRRVKDPEAVLERHKGPPPEHVVADLAELPALLANLKG